MALLGNRIPVGVKVFLSTLAVADDIIAIIVIAVSLWAHARFHVACGSCRGYVGPRRAQQVARVLARALPCAGRGAVVLRFLEWRRHSTIAGVLLAFTIPSGSRVNLKGFVAWSDKKIRQDGKRVRPR